MNDFIVEEHVKNALKEDIGFWDITSNTIFEDDYIVKAKLNSRADGILCGVNVVKKIYEILNPKIEVKILINDGEKIAKGSLIAEIKGSCKDILMGERVALNYVQRMSAIATLANKYAQAVKPYKAKVVDTRKTTPLFRAFEKYAVITGGAALHRFNLSDCVMIKDNHIEYAGSIKNAVEKVKANVSHAHKIEVETENFKQVKEALEAGADIIMLDNMSLEEMKKSVEYINGRAIVEASGNVTLDTINSIAATGVDIISTSAMQSKAGTLDLGLDV
ncbi:MAG: carboxylating nicotinate-nucleotide diphosphorylase [bacterium]|nr:carboxylating nicotinate-nucleotide diphosphorylase [bacterium]